MDHLILFQQEGTDYFRLITTATPGFSDLPTALVHTTYTQNSNWEKTEITRKNRLTLW